MGVVSALKDFINGFDEDPLDEEDQYDVANDVVEVTEADLKDESVIDIVEEPKEGEN